MVTLFVIGILLFTIKLVFFACNAAWGLAKVIIFVMGIPIILIVLFIAGLVSFAIPLLILALSAAFLLPFIRGI